MSNMEERTDRVVEIPKPPKSIEAWLGDGSEEQPFIDSLTAYQWIYALLTDREALVRYVVTLHDAYLLEGEILNNEEWQALSQELRDEINAI